MKVTSQILSLTSEVGYQAMPVEHGVDCADRGV